MKTKWISLILSLLGIGGIAATSILSIKGHEKAKTKETKKEKALAYGPAIAAGVVTSACIMGSYGLQAKEIAVLTGTCGYLVANRDKIYSKLKDKLTPEEIKNLKIDAGIPTRKELQENSIYANEKRAMVVPERTGRGNVKFKEAYTGREFYSSFENVIAGEKKLNHDFHQGLYVSLNDLYAYWGLSETTYGEDYGWPANEEYVDYNLDQPIYFDHVKVEDEYGEDMYMIFILTDPMQYWMEL